MHRVRLAVAGSIALLMLTGCRWSQVEFRQGGGGETSVAQLRIRLPDNNIEYTRDGREIDQKLLVKEFTQLQSATKNAGVFASKTYGAASTGGAWYEIRLKGGLRTREWTVYVPEREYFSEEPKELQALRDRLVQIQTRIERWLETPEGRARMAEAN
jgi:hypothetical protein